MFKSPPDPLAAFALGLNRIRPGWFLKRSIQDIQQRLNRRPVSRAGSYMMEPHQTGRIDEHITAALVDVTTRRPEPLPARECLQIGPPCAWPPDVPEPCAKHVVCAINISRFIDQKRPGESGFLDIAACENVRFKRDDDDRNVAIQKGLFMLLQLQQVPAAGQSPQMSMKHHQQPHAPVVFQAMRFAFGIRQGKWIGEVTATLFQWLMPCGLVLLSRCRPDRSIRKQTRLAPCAPLPRPIPVQNVPLRAPRSAVDSP